MAWTDDDKQKMDEAAAEEVKELINLMADPTLKPGIDAVCELFARYYQSAGYKRVCQFMRQMGQGLAKAKAE